MRAAECLAPARAGKGGHGRARAGTHDEPLAFRFPIPWARACPAAVLQPPRRTPKVILVSAMPCRAGENSSWTLEAVTSGEEKKREKNYTAGRSETLAALYFKKGGITEEVREGSVFLFFESFSSH